MPSNRRVILLGSTGSIGRQTVEVIAHLNGLAARGEFPVHHEIVGLAAGRDADAMIAQATSLNVREAAVANGPGAVALGAARGVKVRAGADASERLVREVPCDLVLGAIVGSAGLHATLAAVELGIDVALANKETLVAAGSIVVEACARSGARLLPVDSEHSGIWQCLVGHDRKSPDPRAGVVPPTELDRQVRRVILTASGGALRNRSIDQVYHASPEDALAHPTWSMGAKVTIDSASLTNKALELIEAHWLYGLPSSKLGALIHPQSIIHSIVEFEDGSSIAQMGSPDMRTPIQYALTHPHHAPGCSPRLNWEALSRLELSIPDEARFPALRLGHRVIDEGGTSGAVFNAANEAAVEAFLARRIPFGRIAELSAAALDEVGSSPVRSLADVMEADQEGRAFVAASFGHEPAR
ncbi:MAG: 1-deoxy-D-xylulose-5-phosphate reductoisomerase [Phycisphaerae bacterium]|nr:1-deoxy-D-xylulose-5-phosphate reductoisomerase [Phycisphaerae bacterium]